MRSEAGGLVFRPRLLAFAPPDLVFEPGSLVFGSGHSGALHTDRAGRLEQSGTVDAASAPNGAVFLHYMPWSTGNEIGLLCSRITKRGNDYDAALRTETCRLATGDHQYKICGSYHAAVDLPL